MSPTTQPLPLFHIPRSMLEFFILFNSQGDIGTGLQHSDFWDSNQQRDDSLELANY